MQCEQDGQELAQRRPRVSSDFVAILKSIRFLSVAQNAVDNEAIADGFRTTCISVQSQLQLLLLKTIISDLEETCILAAIVHMDLVLLHTPFEKLYESGFNTRFQETMREMHRAPEQLGNSDIVTWKYSTAAASLRRTTGLSKEQTIVLKENFDAMLSQLEKLSIE